MDPVKLNENGNAVEEKPKDTFVPAKSVKEAEKSAEKYFESEFMDRTFKGKASYMGISLEHANQINRTLEELTEKYPDAKKIAGIKSIDPSSAKGKKIFTSEDAVMAYDPIQYGIYINRKVLKDSASLAKYNADSSEAWDIVINNLDKLSGAQRQVAQRYKDAGRALVGDGSVKDYLTHEYGHHVAWEWLDAKTNNALGARMNNYAPKLSGYATASKNEYLAESFVAYNKNEFDKLDPEYIRAITLKASGSVATLKDRRKTSLEYINKMPDEIFVKYALGPEKSPDKAIAFEKALGYNKSNYKDLKEKISASLQEDGFIEKGDNGYGMRYEQTVVISGPNGKTAKVLTAWIDDGNDKRLTTVHIDD